MRGMAVCFVFSTSRPRFASFYLPSFFVTPAVLDSLNFFGAFFFFNLFPISAATPKHAPPSPQTPPRTLRSSSSSLQTDVTTTRTTWLNSLAKCPGPVTDWQMGEGLERE